MNKNNKISQEDLYKFTALMMNLPYEDEFRRVKVKTKELDSFLENVAEGKIQDSKEFISEGLKETITPALTSIFISRTSFRFKCIFYSGFYKECPESSSRG